MGLTPLKWKLSVQMKRNLARQAKKLTVSLLRAAEHIELRNIKRGKYFRIIADVYVDSVSIAAELLKARYDVRYDGGTKIDWCK